MSIIHPSDVGAEFAAHPRFVAWMLAHPQVIGYRLWGMLVLYFRAGLSQRQIAQVFNLRRQTVSHEFRRAFQLAARHSGRGVGKSKRVDSR